MKVIVTCGPSCEWIDQVRFLSNFSTGELGALLAQALHQSGMEVICLQSRLATYPIEKKIPTIQFSTNEELAAIYETLSREENIRAVFHAAALCDYRVAKITGIEGASLPIGKIPTNMGKLQLTLEPSMKVIAQLRSLFPQAFLVGWKYEVAGSREEANRKAQEQIKKYELNASVSNGPAVGTEFDILSKAQIESTQSSKERLACFLTSWTQQVCGEFVLKKSRDKEIDF